MSQANKYEEARIRNKEVGERREELWITEANNRLIELSRLFLTVTFLIFTLSFALLSDKLPIIRDETLRTLLILSWVSNIFSLISGVIFIISEIFYFLKLSRIYGKYVSAWSEIEGDYEKMSEKAHDALKNFSESSSLIPLVLQIVFASISLFLLFSLGIITIVTK